MKHIAPFDTFAKRHNGISNEELGEMLSQIGVASLDQLIDETVPDSIRLQKELDIPEAVTEHEFLQQLKATASKNKV